MPVLLVAAALLLGIFALWHVWPLRGIHRPQPAASYDAALQRLHLLQRHEASDINPVCCTQLLSHGQKQPRAIVFLHGFTNCPAQFTQLAGQFYARGYNVLNIRLPRHGLADRLTSALSGLTATDLVNLTTEAVDIAQGLGTEVTVMGLSLGGALTAWAAQSRRDLHRAVLVSPALGLTPPILGYSRWIANGLALWPNFYQWWDPVAQVDKSGPQHAYPRFASRGLAALLYVANHVRTEATRSKPAAQVIYVITNANDPVIDRGVVNTVVAAWRKHGATVQTHEFPAEWHLLHDLIDPTQPEAQVERVYPQLLAWIEE
jgi:carboxylesterase